MATRVDFKYVRQNASFETVLAAYGIEMQKDGHKPGQFKALCPFHDDTEPSLKINVERNVYHCFACEAGGNILEFVREMDGEDQIRPAALKVAEICGLSSPGTGRTARRRSSKPKADNGTPDASPPPAKPETPADEDGDGDPYNRVLSFELKTERDDALKVWLEGRGIDHDAQVAFGLGRASKRSKTIADRLAIPIHNASGELVAYCGRYVGDDVLDDAPKYKLPSNFRKELEVFNLHRAVEHEDKHRTWLVFESYFSVMRFHAVAPCVSFMGRSVSPWQVDLMIEHATERGIKRVIVVGDGDEPGRLGAQEMAGALAPHFWTRALDLADGEKPHRLDWDDLSDRLRAIW